MEIYISIDGVLRNTIQKFEYLYNKEFIDSEPEDKQDNFEYRIKYPICNEKLMESFEFHDETEFNNFMYLDYALELFGHSGISNMSVVNELNSLIYNYPNHKFTLIGVDEFGRSRPATLFFLSKYGFLVNNIKFILSKDIDNEWKKCDVWVTDSKKIINKCPTSKMAIKFNTDYNSYFLHSHEINNISKIEELCLKSWVQLTTLMLTKLLKNVGQFTQLKKKKKTMKPPKVV